MSRIEKILEKIFVCVVCGAIAICVVHNLVYSFFYKSETPHLKLVQPRTTKYEFLIFFSEPKTPAEVDDFLMVNKLKPFSSEELLIATKPVIQSGSFLYRVVIQDSKLYWEELLEEIKKMKGVEVVEFVKDQTDWLPCGNKE